MLGRVERSKSIRSGFTLPEAKMEPCVASFRKDGGLSGLSQGSMLVGGLGFRGLGEATCLLWGNLCFPSWQLRTSITKFDNASGCFTMPLSSSLSSPALLCFNIMP